MGQASSIIIYFIQSKTLRGIDENVDCKYVARLLVKLILSLHLILFLAIALIVEIAMGKTTLPIQDLLNSADAIVLGQIYDIQTANNSKIASARLEAAVWLKGNPITRYLHIRLYTVGADEGLASLWLLKKMPDGTLEETYPWMRISPERWLQLPEPMRSKVLESVNHAASEIEGGLRLHIMRVPSLPGRPLQVWLCFENMANQPLKIPFDDPNYPQAVVFEITDPNAISKKVRLLRPEYIQSLKGVSKNQGFRNVVQAKSMLLAYSLASRSLKSTEITLITKPKAGKYTVRATLTTSGKPTDSMRELALLNTAALWSGMLNVTIVTTVATK